MRVNEGARWFAPFRFQQGSLAKVSGNPGHRELEQKLGVGLKLR
jgi:hypothetical protein